MVYESAHAAPADATYVQPALQPRPPKRRTGMLVLAGIIVLITLGIAGAFAYAKATQTQQVAGPAARQPAAVSCEHGTLPNGACAGAPKAYNVPTVKDFELNLKITSKQCFGSAGCNIEFETLLNYLGSGAEPNTSWDITYDVQGGEDPYTNTLTTTFGDDGLHGRYEHEDTEFMQIPKSSTKLTVTITAVTEG